MHTRRVAGLVSLLGFGIMGCGGPVEGPTGSVDDPSSSVNVIQAAVRTVPVLSYMNATGTTGQVGTAMTVSPTTLNNGGRPITSCFTTPALPSGLAINAVTCVISGTPTVSIPTTSFAVKATNSVGTSAPANVALTINGVPTLSYAGAAGTSGTINVAMSVTPTTLATNGSPITACGIKPGTGALPLGLTVNTLTCVISGTPTVTVTSGNYTVVATNAMGTSLDATVTLTVNGGPPSLSYALGGTGSVGIPLTVSATVLTNSGGALVSCGVKAGTPALPAGLLVSPTTCNISGTPTAAAPAAAYTIVAANPMGSSADALVSITVNPAPPPEVVSACGKLYRHQGQYGLVTFVLNQDLTTSATACLTIDDAPPGGSTDSPLNYAVIDCQGHSITASSLVAGNRGIEVQDRLSLQSLTVKNCVIQGWDRGIWLYKADNNAQISLTGNTFLGNVAGILDSLNVYPGVQVSLASNTFAANNVKGIYTFGTPFSFANDNFCGLPTAIYCDGGFSPLSGTASYGTGAIVGNGMGTCGGSISTSSTCAAGAPGLSYAFAAGTTGVINVAMSVVPTVLGNNGSAITGCAIKAGTPALPAGLTVNTLTCVISGTPTVVAPAATYTIVATNAVGSSLDAAIGLAVNGSAPTLSYAAGGTVTVGNPLTVPATLSPNGTLLSCGVKAGTSALPAGLLVNPTTCNISGTPTAAAPTATYTIVAVNAIASSADALVSITVNPAPPPELVSACGKLYRHQGQYGLVTFVLTQDLTTSATACLTIDDAPPGGSTDSPLNNAVIDCQGHSITASSLVAGNRGIEVQDRLSLQSLTVKNCVIQGWDRGIWLYKADNNAQISLTGNTFLGNVAGILDSLNVYPGVQVSLASNTFAANNVKGIYTFGTPFSFSNDNFCGLPTAIYCDGGFSPLSGTASYGTGAIVGNGSGTCGGSISPSSTCAPAAPALSYAFAAGTTGVINVAMSVVPTVLGDNGSPITGCAIKAGTPALPAGLTVNTLTCVISGTPTVVAPAATYTIVATNAAGSSMDAAVGLAVNGSAPTLSYAAGGTVTAGNPLTVPATLAPNGTLISCGVKAGTPALPAGLLVNPTTCNISGTPTASAPAATYTIVAANAIASSADALVSITVNPAPPPEVVSACGKLYRHQGQYGLVTFVLNQDLTTSATACLTIDDSPPGASTDSPLNNAVIDCQGHSITASPSLVPGSRGIDVDDRLSLHSLTIKNCVIQGWDRGISLYRADQNAQISLTGNTFQWNTNGILDSFSTFYNANVSLASNTFAANNVKGIYTFGTPFSFANDNFCGLSTAIYCDGGFSPLSGTASYGAGAIVGNGMGTCGGTLTPAATCGP